MGDPSPDQPAETLPAGVELPDGRVLTYPAARACPCESCTLAFEAHDAGTLIVHDDDPDDLPW